MLRIVQRPTHALAEILYGLAIHDQVRTLARQRGSLEHLFELISFGDLLGMPREAPDLVRSVITFGSPIVGGPKYTAVGRIYAQQGVDLDALEAEIEGREATPIRVPITAIWSRVDGVVAW